MISDFFFQLSSSNAMSSPSQLVDEGMQGKNQPLPISSDRTFTQLLDSLFSSHQSAEDTLEDRSPRADSVEPRISIRKVPTEAERDRSTLRKLHEIMRVEEDPAQNALQVDMLPSIHYRRTPDTLSIVLQSPQANYENRNELSGIPRNQTEASTHRAMSLSEDVDIEQNIEAPFYEEALNSRIPVSEPHPLAQHTADFPKSDAEHFSKEKIQQLNVQRSPDIAALSTSSTTAVQPLPLSFLVIPSHNETAPKNSKTIENDDPMGRREDLTQNRAHLTHLQEIAHPISSEELRESFIAPPTVDKSTFNASFQNRTSITSEQQLPYPEHELAVIVVRALGLGPAGPA